MIQPTISLMYSLGGQEELFSLRRQPEAEGTYCQGFRPCCYASVPSLLQVDAVVVGADRVVANGDTANKIGT